MTLKFLLRYEDEERQAIITNCADWDEIVPSLVEMEGMIDSWAWTSDEEAKSTWMNAMRVLFETLYVAGYQRGIAERRLL